jgi:hypothetical protein
MEALADKSWWHKKRWRRRLNNQSGQTTRGRGERTGGDTGRQEAATCQDATQQPAGMVTAKATATAMVMATTKATATLNGDDDGDGNGYDAGVYYGDDEVDDDGDGDKDSNADS